jgi:hypothetical protein
MTHHPDVALLCPVPEEHLEDGAILCQEEGRVAFGSQAWELFEVKLDKLRKRDPVRVLIYASHSKETRGPIVSWEAAYLRYVRSVGGMHPDDRKYRAASTEKEDRQRYWGGFWEVENLRKLEPEEQIKVADLTGYASQSHFKLNFVPEGPLLIENPR